MSSPPSPLPTAAPLPVSPLAYASPTDFVRAGHSRAGIASLIFCGVTLVYTVVCTVGMLNASGWDGLGWLVVGLMGNWIGAGVGAVLGLVGVCQRRRRRVLAVHGLWVSAALALVPLAIAFVGQHL